MTDIPNEITLIHDLQSQLQNGNSVIVLSAEYRQVFLELLERSAKQSPQNIEATVLDSLRMQKSEIIILEPPDAVELCEAITLLIGERTYREVCVDIRSEEEVLAHINEQLGNGNRICISLWDINTLTAILDASASLPDQQWMNGLSSFLREKRGNTTPEEIHIDLPHDMADALRAELCALE